MMVNNFLISLSENDKRFLIALLLIFILIFVLIGVIGSIIYRITKWQGKKMDTLVHDVVVTKVITDKDHLIKYGRKKNWRLFFNQALIPMAALIVINIFLFIYEGTHGWKYNPWSVENGFGSLFFTFKFTNEYNVWFIFAFPKLVVTHTPTFNIANWCGYIYCPLFIVACAWYLFVIQALIGRTLRLYKLSKTVFEKSLEGYNQTSGFASTTNTNQNTLPNEGNDLNIKL